jgi:regulatory protein
VSSEPASGVRLLDPEEKVQRALDLAYAYLNRRARTEAEVRGRLEQRGIDSRTVELAIEALIDQRVVDDARYAQSFVEDKRGLDQWGADRIRRALGERGIDRELIERTLAHTPGESELDRALEILRRRFPVPPRERRERDRALGVLLRKGYDPELAVDALGAYARDATDEELR